ncbi:MAG: tetratricopeptide repeat protein [Planctomycetes bacterium]|nr:tetratricopeptide repeat protein [Planctomycetota bacterium]
MRGLPPFAAFILLLATVGLTAAGGDLHTYVASHTFVVSVAPVDEESRQAENSVLFQRSTEDGDWESIGPCQRTVRPDGDIRFLREVTVATDGVYQFTSRPVVGGRVVFPPDASTAAQAVVVVDTLPPVVTVLEPDADQEVLPGDTVKITWTVTDEHLGDAPVTLASTHDGGRSWQVIAREQPASGSHHWKLPEGDGSALLRVTAIDLAGNMARELRRLTPTAPPEPEAAAAVDPDEVAGEPTRTPDPGDGNDITATEASALRDPNRSWLYYLMAINLMRQEQPADALQYYWLAVKEDPEFVDAWTDMVLAYIDLGAYRTAREVAIQTRERAPERIDLMHLLGESYHAEGMAVLGAARTPEDRLRAKNLVDQAVEWYGRALDQAGADWRLHEGAPSFYRLGEICYYVNLDRDGARAYWERILELHAPTPNSDLILWSPPDRRDQAKRRHQRQVAAKVLLHTWQNWARGYLEQLDARERAGILDLMPAQRVSAAAVSTAACGGDSVNPGRYDGRSLFSLSPDLGGAALTPTATVASSPPESTVPSAQVADPMAGYSFYGSGSAGSSPPSGSWWEIGSGGPGSRDPLLFPTAGGNRPGWSGYGGYGDTPGTEW